MILIDSNIPMYLVGADHPNKGTARRLLEELVTAQVALVTDAEVLQEILHRYHAINRPEAIQPAFDAVLGVVEEVVPIERAHAERAKDLMAGSSHLSARDAIHVAVMEAEGITQILSFDSGFDDHPGIQRL